MKQHKAKSKLNIIQQDTKMVKAQISFFILLGFVVLLAVGIAMFILTSPAEQKMATTSAKQKISLQLQPLKEAINNCLKLTSKEAITKLGKQGGYLYKDQGGSADTPPTNEEGQTYVEYDNEKTRYLIDEPQGTIADLFYTQTPKYPWDTFPYASTTDTTQIYLGYYGLNKLPPLYKPYENSIQEQLETYIANNINKCIKPESYPALQITFTQPNVTLFVADAPDKIKNEESTYFAMNWQITAKEKTTSTITTLTDFGTTINIPLAKAYYNITAIINKDIQNLTYEPTPEGNYVARATKLTPDSIVIVKFPTIRIDDAPYEFRFARHTRLPAIHLIKELKNKLILSQRTLDDTIQLAKGATITIQGDKLLFNGACCPSSTTCPWMVPQLDLNISDPDGEQNNANLKSKFQSQARESDTTVKFTRATPENERPTEVIILTQKQDTIDTRNKKEDSQTFYVRVYECATP